MKFEKDFFKDECIDGFMVGSRMKRYWAASIETLEEIDKVCRKHNIVWYADWGTLLGTIRHKGFIPWDDDIDIAMKRADYERFLKIAEQELPKHYIVCDSDSEKYWVNNAAVVSNWDESSYALLEKNRLIKYHGCPFSISIDVFALDYMYEEEEKEKVRDELLMEIWYAIAAIDTKKDEEQIKQRIQTLEMATQMNFSQFLSDYENLKRQLRHVADTVMQICTEEDSEELTELRWLLVGEYETARFKKEWYEEVIYMPFNGFQMPVPREYDKILKGMYGDYMTPVQGTACHDYPKFKGMVDIFEQWRKETGEKRTIEQIVTDLTGEDGQDDSEK